MPNSLNLTKTRQWAESFVQRATKYTRKLRQIPKLFSRANIKKVLTKLKAIRKERAKLAKRDDKLMAREHKLTLRLDEKKATNFERCEGYLSKKELSDLF